MYICQALGSIPVWMTLAGRTQVWMNTMEVVKAVQGTQCISLGHEEFLSLMLFEGWIINPIQTSWLYYIQSGVPNGFFNKEDDFFTRKNIRGVLLQNLTREGSSGVWFHEAVGRGIVARPWVPLQRVDKRRIYLGLRRP